MATTTTQLISVGTFSPTGQKRVLIVDDNEIVLTALAIAVEHLLPDYQITAVEDGATALAELQKQGFDLILTDYDMPQMNGLDLAQVAQQISPKIPVILVTGGHSYEEIQAMADSTQLAGFLAKPFSMRQLRELLQQNEI